MARLTAALVTAVLVASAPALADTRCTLELDGATHELEHVYVVGHRATVSDLEGVHDVVEHVIFCSIEPLELDEALMDDPVTAYRMAALRLDRDDRVEVELAHDGRVRRVQGTWGEVEISTALDGDLPMTLSGSLTGGRAEATLDTSAPIVQEPTPWYDQEARWRLEIELDGITVQGDTVQGDTVQGEQGEQGVEGVEADSLAGGPPPATPTAGTGSPVATPTADLSPSAQELAKALDALRAELPDPPAIVQLVAFPGGTISASVEVGGEIVDYTLSGGQVQGPVPMDTQYLECKDPLPPGELDLSVLPALWDDAPVRAGTPDKGTLQIIVAQHPCGTAWVSVPVEGPAGVYYSGDGRFQRTD